MNGQKVWLGVKEYFQSLIIKTLVMGGLLLLSLYLVFRVQLINLNPLLAAFSTILFLAELHTIFHLFGMFYSLWFKEELPYKSIYRNKNLRINIFICVCGEPAEVVRTTILGAKRAARYYTQVIHPQFLPRIYVLNDGLAAKKDNWKEVEVIAKELGVNHIARKIPGGFKAGNINNALNETPTTDPQNTIDLIFDSDFAAKQECLVEITKPFINQSIDFVQSPQRYRNEKTWVAKAAAAHQIFFFDFVCPAKGFDNALFLCGTNFAIRRSAFEAVGGMDTRFITEDYATSLNLHLKGRRGVFMPKVLALGIAPSSLKAYFSQQTRWSKGNFDVTRAYLKELIFGPLTLRQKFHYLLSATYYLIGLRDLILMLAPLPYLFFNVSLIRANTLTFLILIYGPLLLYNFILYTRMFKHPIKSLVLDIVSFPVFTVAFLSSLLQKQLGFIVTIKKYEKENPFKVYRIQLAVAALLSAGLYYNLRFQISSGFGAFINFFWAVFDTLFLTLGFILMVRENYKWEPFLRLSRFFSGFSRLLSTKNLPHSPATLLRPAYILLLIVGITFLNTNLLTLKTLAYTGSNKLQTNPPNEAELVVPDDGVYYGYYLPQLNDHPQNPPVSLIPGERPSLVMFYEDWSVGEGFDTRFMNDLSAKNIIPVVTWEPWDAKAAASSIAQKDFTPKLIAGGKYDDYVRRWAKGAAAYDKPLFLRFAHEMNGNWYGWGNINGNTPEDYKEMWIHVYKIFQEEKADNVVWVWAPNNTNEFGDSDTMLSYYPGSEYVDWVGFSGFNWGTTNSFNRWTSFRTLALDAYFQLSLLEKPIMVAETSSVSRGGNKASWFARTLSYDVPSLPKIKAIVLYNADFKNADFDLGKNMDAKEIINANILENSFYIKGPRYLYIS